MTRSILNAAVTRGTTTVGGLTFGLLLAIGLRSAAAEGLPIAAPARQEPVRFADEVVPMLAANCTACHNQKVREGGLSMDSLDRMLAGGDSGPSVVAGKPAESVLFLRASHRQEDFMPPPSNSVGAKNLSPEQLGLLERWIAEGAKATAVVAKPIQWRPLPKGTGGVIAVAMSGDGRMTAAARAGRVSLYDTLSGRGLTTLVDPGLAGFAPDVAHADTVSALAFSPAEDLLATGSFRTIKLWKRSEPRRIAELPGTAGASLLARAATGGVVVLGLPDGRLAVADAAAAEPASGMRLFGMPGQPVTAAAIAPDGGSLFTAAKDNVVTAWRLADGVAIGRLARPGEVRSLAVVNGGTRLVTAEADSVLRLWELPLAEAAADPTAAKPIKEIAGAPQPLVGLVEMPAVSGHVVAGCGDGVVRLWNLETGGVVRQFAHGGAVAGIAVSPDGSRLATVGTVPGLKLWNAADGAMILHVTGDHRIADRLAARDADITVLKQDVEFAKGQVAAAEKAKGTAAEEVKKAGEKLAAAEKTFKEKDDAAKAAKAARDEADRLSAMATAAVPLAEAAVEVATKAAASAAAGAEAAAAAAASFAKAAEGNADAAEPQKTIQAASAAAAAAKTAADQALAQARQHVEKSKAKATDLAAKAAEKVKAQAAADEALAKARTGIDSAKRDGEFAAAEVKRADEAFPARQADLAAVEGQLKTAETERGGTDAERNASARPFAAVAFAADASSLVSLDPAGWAVFSGAQDGQPRRAVAVAAQAAGLAAIGDGRLVVAGGPAAATVTDVREQWILVRTIGGETTPPAVDDDPAGPPVDAVLALAFSPDGSLLASGSGRASRSGEIKLWKTADGTLARSIPQPHSDTVVSLAFSRAGDRLASGGTDRFAKVHLVADGKTERSFEGHTGHVLGVAWQAHGRRLVTGGADNV
ncbi:MAG: c-type cytochrome domain-containing protein, partial [Planctomycetota bacterium]